jgi:hypothetical protein
MDAVITIRISSELKVRLYEMYGKNVSSKLRQLIEEHFGDSVSSSFSGDASRYGKSVLISKEPDWERVKVEGKRRVAKTAKEMEKVVRDAFGKKSRQPKVQPGCLGAIAHEAGTCKCWEGFKG